MAFNGFVFQIGKMLGALGIIVGEMIGGIGMGVAYMFLVLMGIMFSRIVLKYSNQKESSLSSETAKAK